MHKSIKRWTWYWNKNRAVTEIFNRNEQKVKISNDRKMCNFNEGEQPPGHNQREIFFGQKPCEHVRKCNKECKFV